MRSREARIFLWQALKVTGPIYTMGETPAYICPGWSTNDEVGQTKTS